MFEHCVKVLCSSTCSIEENVSAVRSMANSLPMQYFLKHYYGGSKPDKVLKFIGFVEGKRKLDDDCITMINEFSNYLIFGSDTICLYQMQSDNDVHLLQNSNIWSVNPSWNLMRRMTKCGYKFLTEKKICVDLRITSPYKDLYELMIKLSTVDAVEEQASIFLCSTGLVDLVFGYMPGHKCFELCRFIEGDNSGIDTNKLSWELHDYIKWYNKFKSCITSDVMISDLRMDTKLWLISNNCYTINKSMRLKIDAPSIEILADLDSIRERLGYAPRKSSDKVKKSNVVVKRPVDFKNETRKKYDIVYEIDNYGLSVRARNGLLRRKMYTRHEVVAFYEKEGIDGLKAIPHIGENTVGEIINTLKLNDTDYGVLSEEEKERVEVSPVDGIYPFIAHIDLGMKEFIRNSDFNSFNRILMLLTDMEFDSYIAYLKICDASDRIIEIVRLCRQGLRGNAVISKLGLTTSQLYTSSRSKAYTCMLSWINCTGEYINSYVFDRMRLLSLKNSGVTTYAQLVSPAFKSAVNRNSTFVSQELYGRILESIKYNCKVEYPKNVTVKKRHIINITESDVRAYIDGRLTSSEITSKYNSNIVSYAKFIGVEIDETVVYRWMNCIDFSFKSYNIDNKLIDFLQNRGVDDVRSFKKKLPLVKKLLDDRTFRELCELFDINFCRSITKVGKIFVVIGRSSVGKDTIYARLLKEKSIDLKRIVTYTTRPMRTHETNGVEYHFVDEIEMKQMRKSNKIIECRCYETMNGNWYYFTARDNQIDLNNYDYIVIGTLESFMSFKKVFGVDLVIPIYIELDKGDILERALNREKGQVEPKYAEMCRRFIDDSNIFNEENIIKAGITKRFRNINLDRCVKEIVSYIQSFG